MFGLRHIAAAPAISRGRSTPQLFRFALFRSTRFGTSRFFGGETFAHDFGDGRCFGRDVGEISRQLFQSLDRFGFELGGAFRAP